MSADATEVIANDGIVTLRGDAASQAQKDLTTEYAKNVDGVKAPGGDAPFRWPSLRIGFLTGGVDVLSS